MKKPSPLIMKSVERPVFCVEPWLKLVLIPATLTPSPTCAGLVPAVSAVGAEPLRSSWESVSSKTVVLLLKPTVLTLAMLLPTTSIFVWCARRPEMAENIERSMGWNSSLGGFACGAGRGRSGDLGDAAQRHGLPADPGRGLGGVVAEDHRRHRAGLRGAAVIGVGHGVTDDDAGVHGLLQGHDRGVLRDQLVELLHLAERRRLRHELAGVGRVARVLVAHLGDQQLEERVLVHLVRAVHGRRGGARGDRARAAHRCCHRRHLRVQTRTSTPVDADDEVEVRAGRPSPVSGPVRSHEVGRASPRCCEPCPPCCRVPCCCVPNEPPVSRETSSRESVRPALCRSRRRSGSASSSAARPCSCAPARLRSSEPLLTVTCTWTGPRLSGFRTTVIVCTPSGRLARTATGWVSCAATGGCAAGVLAATGAGATTGAAPGAGGVAVTVAAVGASPPSGGAWSAPLPVDPAVALPDAAGTAVV